MAAQGEWNFIIAVLFFYGFLYSMFVISAGQIAGIGQTISFPTTAAPTGNSVIDLLNSANYLITTMWSFFVVMFLTPFSGYWWLAAINWAFLGTTIYLFIRVLRGGG